MCRTKKMLEGMGQLKMLPRWAVTAALLLTGSQVWAHRSPATCGANGTDLDIARNKVNIINGEVVTYTVTLENPTGGGANCDATLGPGGLVLICPGLDGTPSGSVTVLIAGGTLIPAGFGPVSFDRDCTVTVNPGVATATARTESINGILHDNNIGDGSDLDLGKEIAVNIFNPCIEVTKECDGAPFAYNTPIRFRGTVRNCGDIILHNVTVTDDQAGLVFGPADLAAGATANYNGQYDPTGNLCGPFTDIVTASGVASDLDVPVTRTATATVTCPVSTAPCIEVTKVCGPASIQLGGSYSVSGTVRNCGNVPLINVVVVDTITDANGGVTTVTIPIPGTLGVGQTAPIPPQSFTPTLCGPHRDQFTVRAENPCPQGPAVPPATSQLCTTQVLCPPDVEVVKEVACYLPGDTCGTYGPTATGVSDGACPAFCYRITVQNASATVPITTLTVIDNVLGDLSAAFASSLPLAPGASAVREIKAVTHCADTPNTVTVTGGSSTGQTDVDQASAEALVLNINIECSLALASSFDLDGNATDNHVTLPAGSVNTPVQVTLTLRNTGSSPLNVTSVAGLPALVTCDAAQTPVNLATVLGLPRNIPANSEVTTIVGCWLVSCPGGSIAASAHAEASSEGGTLCVYDSSGNIVDDDSPECPASVSCEVAVTCRTTGGGVLLPGTSDQSCIAVNTTIFPLTSPNGLTIKKITHGGQLGAPFAQEDCGEILGNPCIRGQWQHVRHYQGTANPRDVFDMNFHSVTPKGVFDSLNCVCLGCCDPETGVFISPITVGNLCNPDDRKVCGPQPRPAPANAIIFSGIGRMTPEDDVKGSRAANAEWVVFRVYIEDRSEPGGFHPKGAVEPADIYCFQAWKTGIKTSKKPDFSTIATTFRQALGRANCDFLAALSSGALPIGTLPSPTVTGLTADVQDCGPMSTGNHQIHPSTSATCE